VWTDSPAFTEAVHYPRSAESARTKVRAALLATHEARGGIEVLEVRLELMGGEGRRIVVQLVQEDDGGVASPR
jgi:hypothetical protein